MNSFVRVLLRVVGIGALVAGGVAVALAALVAMLLLGPLVFWLAWNVLDFGHAVGLPELGFWGVVLAMPVAGILNTFAHYLWDVTIGRPDEHEPLVEAS